MDVSTSIKKNQDALAQIVKAVVIGGHPGGCIVGGPGTGKSRNVRAVLKDLNIVYKDVPLHSSPLQLVKFIEDSPGDILLWDDVAENKHPTHIAVQKALFAPDPATGKKIIRVNVSDSIMKREGLKNREIEFTGRIIIVMNANELSEDIHSLAMRSRIPYFKYDLTFDERMYLLKKMSEDHDSFSLTKEQMKELVTFIEESAHDGVENFDLRLLGKAAAVVKGSPENWQDGVRSLIDADPRYRLIKSIASIASDLNLGVEDQVRIFQRQSGQSRSTYFNLCRKFNLKHSYQFDRSLLHFDVVNMGKKRSGRATENKSKSPSELVNIETQGADRHGVEVQNES